MACSLHNRGDGANGFHVLVLRLHCLWNAQWSWKNSARLEASCECQLGVMLASWSCSSNDVSSCRRRSRSISWLKELTEKGVCPVKSLIQTGFLWMALMYIDMWSVLQLLCCGSHWKCMPLHVAMMEARQTAPLNSKSAVKDINNRQNCCWGSLQMAANEYALCCPDSGSAGDSQASGVCWEARALASSFRGLWLMAYQGSQWDGMMRCHLQV